MSAEELGILRKAASDFILKHYIQIWEVEDLINEGYLMLSKIRGKYKENLYTKYTTFLYSQLTYHFLNITRKDRSGVVITMEDFNEYIDTVESQGIMSYPPAILKEVSEEARALFDAAANMPQGLFDYLNSMVVGNLSYNRCICKYVGIPQYRFKQYKNEIKENIL